MSRPEFSPFPNLLMRLTKHLLAVTAATLLCSCAPAAKRAASPVPAPEKKEAAARLSPEDAKKVERLYYKAVGAYSDNDLPAARNYLVEISSINPSYPPAAELKERIKRISGGK